MDVDSMPLPPAGTAENTLTVLIVEDEFLVRWPAAEFLRERGYAVIEATDVADAISVLGSGAKVDVVFSDIALRGEGTGHDLGEWLAQHHPNIPLLLTSASRAEANNVTPSDKRRFVAKPYELGEVGALLDALCRAR